MPSVLQLAPLPYRHVAETMFLGGTEIEVTGDRAFRTRKSDYEVRFSGRDLVWAADGVLAGGTIDGFQVSVGPPGSSSTRIIVTSNFTLLAVGEFNAAFQFARAGRTGAAVSVVLGSWAGEYFSHTSHVPGTMRGYAGGDGLISSGGDDTVRGHGGDDTMLLGAGSDIGLGGQGRDLIYGGAGDDILSGGPGDDLLRGDTGNDLLVGGASDDAIRGESGDDRLFGGAGRDDIDGGAGNDSLSGGDGDDVLRGRSGADRLAGGAGNDLLDGGPGDDILAGGPGDDVLFGGGGADSLFGGAGNDSLFGGDGADLLAGGRGENRLRGGGGDDWLITEGRVDDMGGGSGADTFQIVPRTARISVIADFEDDIDTILLDGFGFGTVAEALATALETVGGDVIFALAAGQTLLVRNATRADLADDLILA